MAIVVNMPRLSDTMEEGTVAAWLKNVGDTVEEGDILAEIETDKATMEFESFNEGVLLHIGIPEGETAPVDVLLAIIGEEGEDISQYLNGNSGAEKKTSDSDNTIKSEKVSEKKSEEQIEGVSDSFEIPDNVEVIKMPRLSDTMEEGTVAAWLKNVGDTVEEGDILAEIETDKATMEFESFYAGTLLYVGLKEGETSPVDAVLAIIGPKGTDVDAILNAKPSSETKVNAASSDVKDPEREVAKEQTQTEQNSTSDSDKRIFVSPLARKIAEDKGIDLTSVKGSGDHGRIIKKDIENFKATKASLPIQDKSSVSKQAPVSLPVGEEGSKEVKNSPMRKVIAKVLRQSKFTAPHFYMTIEVSMDNAKASRVQINSLPDTKKVSFNDMVLKACAMALKKHPQVNTSWNGDTTRYNSHIHMGVAVAVDEGLVVPVVKFADQLGLSEIGAQVKDLAGKARSKKIAPSEMEGSTFTVSNLGMFGILDFTSIINQPNSAILSVGAIVEKPVVKDGQIVVGNTMKLTLACDHRTVDGAVGAQFLQTLRYFIENPVTMLA